MKKLFCVLLTLICICALCSCDLIETFLSYDRVEVEGAPTDSNNPNFNRPENEEPTLENTDFTIPEISVPEVTGPEIVLPDLPGKDENNDGVPDDDGKYDGTIPDGNTTTPAVPDHTTPEETTATNGTPEGPEEQTITVRVEWQSGGVHRESADITTTAPATLSYVYYLFAEQCSGNVSSSEVLSIGGIQINGKWVDASEIIYVQNGDYIYAVEWNAELSSHLHVWDGPNCARCGATCSHDEWQESAEWGTRTCFFCKTECWHSEWRNSQCVLCGKMCEHKEWNDSRQCLTCLEYLGVNLLQIEIYIDGEQRYGDAGVIETMLQTYLMNWYYWNPPYYFSWEEVKDNYQIYFNNVLITDDFYMITESGRIDLVTRIYE